MEKRHGHNLAWAMGKTDVKDEPLMNALAARALEPTVFATPRDDIAISKSSPVRM